MKKLKTYKLALYIGLFISVLPSLAQDANITSDTVAVKEIEIIPLSDIPNKIPEASLEIRQIRSELVPDSILVYEKEQLDTFLLNYNLFLEDYPENDTSISRQSNLEDQLYLWKKQKEDLFNIQSEFEKIQNQLNEQKVRINKHLEVWEKSKEVILSDEEVPENIMQLINSFLESTGYVKDTINQKTNFVYTQIEKITATTISIDDHIADIESELRKATSQGLTDKGPSLFYSIFKSNEKIELFGNFSTNIKRTVIPLTDFYKSNSIEILFHVVFFLILIVAFIYIKRNLNFTKYREMNRPLINGILVLFENPISTSFLISLLFSFILYAGVPIIVRQITLILLLIPLMILIPKLTIKELRNYIYGLGVIFLLFNFHDFAYYRSTIDSISKVIVGGVVIYGLLKIIRTNILSKLFQKKSSTFIFTTVFSLFIVFLSIGIPAIFIGYNSLGIFLIVGVVFSLYIFILFFTGYQLVAGLTEIILNSDLLLKFKVVKKNISEISSWIHSLLYSFTILFLFYFFLKIFNVEETIVNSIKSIWEFGFNIGQLNISIGNILIFFFTLWLAILISKITSAILEQDVLSKMKLKRGVPRTISTLVKYAIITIGFLLAIAAAGVKLQNLTIIISAFGVGIGFGLQDVINNFISGLILLFERPIQVGDAVQVGQLWGNVKQIGIRSSIIRTFDGSEVIVPNGMLISQEVTNWTLSDSNRRLELKVGVAYGSDLKKVREILLKCASDNEGVMEDPPPAAWFTGFGDSSIDFRLVFWHPNFEGGLTVISEVGLAIDTALKKASITIPFPQRDLYIKEVKDTTNREEQILKKNTPKKIPPKK